MRKNKTSAERRLWWSLRSLEPRGYKFRQQGPIDQFIADFVCLSHRLSIEVDGATHGPSPQGRGEKSVAEPGP